MSIRKEDLYDLDIVDSFELLSDGYTTYLTTSVISTSNIDNSIVINLPADGEGIITGKDHPVEVGDRVWLTGTSGGLADGYFIINSILTDTSFTISTTISTSTGGTIYFMYQSGAKSVGFDPTGLVVTTAKNVQDAIRDVAQNATGISSSQHAVIRQLIHFISEGPAEGFASGAYKEILPLANPFPTSIIWYTDISKTNKIVEKIISYNTNKTPSTIIWKMYDTSNILLVTVTDTISYSGVFELSRIRTII